MSEPYQQHPGSVLDIRPGFIPLAFLLFFFKPHFSINRGPDAVGKWKRNVVPVGPGRYEVTVWVSYLFRPQMGISSIVVDVPPGAAAIVTWRAPLTIFGSGRIRVAGVEPLSGGQPGAQPGGQPQGWQPGQGQPQGQGGGQPPAAATSGPAGWHQDPTSRHQLRYYDGSQWTEHVSDGGQQASDPIQG